MTEKTIYSTLKDRFHKLNEVDAQAILAFEYTWQDQFAQSIYQHEIEDGTIKIHYVQKAIDWEYMWSKRTFKRIISEWKGHIPILAFNSIGEYLFFYKAVFHLNGPLAAKIISNEVQDMETAYRNYLNEDAGWQHIESYVYGAIQNSLQQ